MKRTDRRIFLAILFVSLCVGMGNGNAKEEKHSDPNRSCTSKECHPDVLQHEVLHGPLAIGQCMVCHTPIPESDHKFKLAADKQHLCNLCHKPVDNAANLHDPVKKGECMTCHDPHGSHSKAQVRKDWIAKVCIDCHKDPVLTHAGEADFPHAKLLEEKKCVSCHSPHFSSHPHLLRDHVDRTCYTCHEDLQKEVKAAKFVHGPIKEGDCGSCHYTHGTKHADFLPKFLTERFYAGFDLDNFEFCFSCHEHKEQLVTERRTETGTNFRNGNLNLHYVHVNRPFKGRTCRTCHATHSAPNKALVAPQIPFGKWMIPIQYTATDSGGACSSGCHKPLRYDRLDPVDYQEKKP